MVRDLLPKPEPAMLAGHLALIEVSQRAAECLLAPVAYLRDVIAVEYASFLIGQFLSLAAAPLKMGKGAHNAAYNAELVLRYELAADGEKNAAAAEVAQRYRREPSAALRQVRRLQMRGLTWQELVTAPPDLLGSYLAAQQRDALCQITIGHHRASAVEG